MVGNCQEVERAVDEVGPGDHGRDAVEDDGPFHVDDEFATDANSPSRLAEFDEINRN